MRKTLCTLCAMGWLVAAQVEPASAQHVWTEARSPHFTFVSDGGDKTARSVAWQLEQMRAAIQRYWTRARLGRRFPRM